MAEEEDICPHALGKPLSSKTMSSLKKSGAPPMNLAFAAWELQDSG